MPNADAVNLLNSLGTLNSASTSRFLALLGGSMVLLMIMVIWSLIWKGIALWYAARRGEKVWYVLLLILNTVGILEIIYIFAVAKRSDKVAPKPMVPPAPPAPPSPPTV